MPLKFVRFQKRQGARNYSLHPALVTPILAVMVIAGILSLQVFRSTHFSQAAQARPSATLVTFPGTVSPLIATSHLNGQAGPAQRISFSIGLKLGNENGLKNYVK